jgi:hypothetical protein
MRFFSNALANLAFVPVILTCNREALKEIAATPPLRHVELVLCALPLVVTSIAVFINGSNGGKMVPVVLYASLPILL